MSPFTITQPADSSRKPLKFNFLLGQLNPSDQGFVMLESLDHHFIGHINIFRVTGKCHPSEGTFLFTKERSDISRHETGIIEGVGSTRFPTSHRYIITRTRST